VIETARLVLRPPRPEDYDPIGAMNGDPEVNHWLGRDIPRADSDALLDRVAARIADIGYGFFVTERVEDGAVIGMIGLAPIDFDCPVKGRIEIGWRLARSAWGQGYAAEGARALLAYGFQRLGFEEIVAFTATTNARSEAVMQRIGMERRPELDFDHYKLAEGHPLRRHIVYSLGREAVPLKPQ
jgi:RimJ/RimL family protein N-acetyltransferase